MKNVIGLLVGFLVSASLLLCYPVFAQPLPPAGKFLPTPLDSWSFNDTNHWTSDNGYAPVSFTNLAAMPWFGDVISLGLNTNVPAWLQYNVMETNGATNLTLDVGSIAFWFSPAWAGTNAGGSGPGDWGGLIEVGGYTADASYGWWSLYLDDVGANIYFTVQPGDGSTTTYLTAPISWTSNAWHFIALTYSATNTALYLDGQLATNGSGITAWPGTNVLAGGFYIGSDSNGVVQAEGAFDDLYTYNVPLDSNAVYDLYSSFYPNYYLMPYNNTASISSAPSSPTYIPMYDAVTGQGYLQWVGSASSCATNANAYQIWITNITATATGSGTNLTMNVTFTIEGGADNVPYDVFANSVLWAPVTNGPAWAWMGQGYHCNTYMLTNLPNTSVLLILGTPQDSDYDGLTDAYKLLVSHIDPNNPDPAGDGIADSDKVLMGVNPLTPIPAFPASLNIQTCPQ